MRLVLPYPVSANRYWRSFVPRGGSRAVVVLSSEAKAYKREVARLAREVRAQPLSGLIALQVLLVPANGICIDLDNALKVTLDALKGLAYDDDAQVRRIVAERVAPDGRGARLEVAVSRLPGVGADLFAEAA